MLFYPFPSVYPRMSGLQMHSTVSGIYSSTLTFLEKWYLAISPTPRSKQLLFTHEIDSTNATQMLSMSIRNTISARAQITEATADTRTCEEFYDCVDSPLGPCCAPFTVGAADGRDTYGGEVGPSVFVVTPVFSVPYFVAEKPVPL